MPSVVMQSLFHADYRNNFYNLSVVMLNVIILSVIYAQCYLC
jgi:hypothetical protein